MLRRIVSGGQTGVDQAALRAARGAGLGVGGAVPRGWLTEEGPAPWLASWGLAQCRLPPGDPPPESDSRATRGWEAECYLARTGANVRDADGTLWLGPDGSPGFGATKAAAEAEAAARAAGYPWLVASFRAKPGAVRAWIESSGIETLNVAGHRESHQPGIGARAEAFLAEVFGAGPIEHRAIP